MSRSTPVATTEKDGLTFRLIFVVGGGLEVFFCILNEVITPCCLSRSSALVVFNSSLVLMIKLVSYLMITSLLDLLICSHFIASWILLSVGGVITQNVNPNIKCLDGLVPLIRVADDVVGVGCVIEVDVVACGVVLSSAGLFIS